MACTSLSCIGDGGCIEALPNGTEGQTLSIVAGVPAWVDCDCHDAVEIDPGSNAALSIAGQVLNLDMADMAAAAACAIPVTLVGGDNLLYSWAELVPRRISNSMQMALTPSVQGAIGVQTPHASIQYDITNPHTCYEARVHLTANGGMFLYGLSNDANMDYGVEIQVNAVLAARNSAQLSLNPNTTEEGATAGTSTVIAIPAGGTVTVRAFFFTIRYAGNFGTSGTGEQTSTAVRLSAFGIAAPA